ncbi:MAG: PASTA domain-containing protein, partial [Chloroflexia bacterium]
GSVVTVTLGAEPGIARVPQVVQYPQAAAEELVRRAGFRVALQEVGCTSTQAGYVDRQEPRGNIQYLQGLTVTLYVSLGREQTVMPEVRRLPLEEARRQVEEAGLTWGFTQGQTQADMPPGVRIEDLGAPGQVISYRVEFGGRIYTDEQMPPGTRLPCRATIHVAYNATPP